MRGSCRTDNRACHRIRCVFYDLSLLFERWLELLMSVSGLQPVCGGESCCPFPPSYPRAGDRLDVCVVTLSLKDSYLNIIIWKIIWTNGNFNSIDPIISFFGPSALILVYTIHSLDSILIISLLQFLLLAFFSFILLAAQTPSLDLPKLLLFRNCNQTVKKITLIQLIRLIAFTLKIHDNRPQMFCRFTFSLFMATISHLFFPQIVLSENQILSSAKSPVSPLFSQGPLSSCSEWILFARQFFHLECLCCFKYLWSLLQNSPD